MDRFSENLTEQFHAWEMLGRGNLALCDAPVVIEPPFVPFPGYSKPVPRTPDDGVRGHGVFGFLRAPEIPADEAPTTLEGENGDCSRHYSALGEFDEISISLPAGSTPAPQILRDVLVQLDAQEAHFGFEVLGASNELALQFVAPHGQSGHLIQLLRSYYPAGGFSLGRGRLREAWGTASDAEPVIVEFVLGREFPFPLANPQSDPLIPIASALEGIEPNGFGMIQILFQPVTRRWGESIRRSQLDRGGTPIFSNADDLAGAAAKMADAPLFSAVVRLVTKAQTQVEAWEVARRLSRALHLYQNPLGNWLAPLDNSGSDIGQLAEDILARQSRRFGMLLSAETLEALVHLPSAGVASEKLCRAARVTRATPPEVCATSGVLLGENSHLGNRRSVRLDSEQRVRHVHLIGATGSGKSNLIANMVTDDVHRGEGVAVIDPHGDLVDEILGSIPGHRVDDVVLIDPADENSGVGMNILSARSEGERTILASDLIAVFERLSTSWGDQMGAMLQNAILAFLYSSRGGTIGDLRTFLFDQGFRLEFLETVSDPQVTYYWRTIFPSIGSASSKASLGSVAIRLDKFLASPPVRRLVSTNKRCIDFEEVMNEGKILLVRLAHGIVGRENASLIGSLVISKLQQAAMARHRVPPSERRDFWVYIDEFANYVCPSMAEILIDARKLRVGFHLAHQDLGQLSVERAVADAVMGVATRVVFRVGDSDAVTLAKGFRHFSADDIQSQKIGQALCRIGSATDDFSLDIPRFQCGERDSQDATRRRVIDSCRRRFPPTNVSPSMSGGDEPADAPPSPLPVPSRPSPPPVVEQDEDRTPMPESSACSPPPPDPPVPPEAPAEAELNRAADEFYRRHGRGGDAHTRLQHDVKRIAERFGYRCTVEEQADSGWIDVALIRGELAVAVEICVTSPTRHEVTNLRQRLREKYSLGISVSPDERSCARLRRAAKQACSTVELDVLRFVTIEGLPATLEELEGAPPVEEKVVKGWAVTTTVSKVSKIEREKRKAEISKIAAEAQRRLEAKARPQGDSKG